MKNIRVTEDQEVDSALNGVIDAAEEGFKLGKKLFHKSDVGEKADVTEKPSMNPTAYAATQTAETAKPFITIDKQSLETKVLENGTLEAYVPKTQKTMRVVFPKGSFNDISETAFRVTINKELSYTLTDGREMSGKQLLGYFEEKSRICKVGDVLYGFPDGKNVTPFRVEEVLKNERTGGTLFKVSTANGAKFSISEKSLGKTFFRSAEKAAEALKAATAALKLNPVTAAPAAVAKTAKAMRKNLTR